MKAFREGARRTFYVLADIYCRCDTDCSGHLYIIDNCKISNCDMKNSSVSPPHFSSAIFCFINSASCLAAVSSFSFEALLWLNNAGADRRVKFPMPAWPQTLIREKCWAYTLQPPGLPSRSLTEHWGSLRSISLTDRGEELNGPNWELGQWGNDDRNFKGNIDLFFHIFCIIHVSNCKGQGWYYQSVKRRKWRG